MDDGFADEKLKVIDYPIHDSVTLLDPDVVDIREADSW